MSNSIMSTTSMDNDNTDNQNNNPPEFIASPKGTKPLPFTKKIRGVAHRYDTLIVSIPTEICHLLQLGKGDHLKVYCDIENGGIIMDKL